jgi:A/G-specific adenine glycosylase
MRRMNGSTTLLGELTPSWKGRLRRRILAWYARHARDLPWRHEPTPYRVWVSEIMLQQTQVATVRAYFSRFMAAFPTVHDLAAVEEEDILRLWEGLGYYRRARQMHAAARLIVDRLGGHFPGDVQGLRQLPGIGRYTAGAIGSLAALIYFY